jgi:hypothetical protein
VRDYLRIRRKGRNTFIVFCRVARTRIDFRDSGSIALPHLISADAQKLGGSKGCKIRAARLTPERTRVIVGKAALGRWAKARNEPSRGDLQDKI